MNKWVDCGRAFTVAAAYIWVDKAGIG